MKRFTDAYLRVLQFVLTVLLFLLVVLVTLQIVARYTAFIPRYIWTEEAARFLFILAANLMNSSGITERLVDLTRSMVGHFRGGLGHIGVVVGMIFAGISGSSTRRRRASARC